MPITLVSLNPHSILKAQIQPLPTSPSSLKIPTYWLCTTPYLTVYIYIYIGTVVSAYHGVNPVQRCTTDTMPYRFAQVVDTLQLATKPTNWFVSSGQCASDLSYMTRKIVVLVIRTHDLWIRKRVCYQMRPKNSLLSTRSVCILHELVNNTGTEKSEYTWHCRSLEDVMIQPTL